MITLQQNGFPREDLNYKAFLIRIWRSSPDAPWRAYAQDTENGEQRHFSSLENLFLFLHDFTNDQPDPEL
jgi:hypothetical protein